MLIEEQKKVADKAIRALNAGTPQTDLYCPDATHWTPRMGVRTMPQMQHMVAAVLDKFTTGINLNVRSITAEDNRVIIEAKGNATLKNGGPYENDYCFVVEFDGELIRAVREYNDARKAEAALGKISDPPQQVA
jgi:ketosteroid isomerase-like protein